MKSRVDKLTYYHHSLPMRDKLYSLLGLIYCRTEGGSIMHAAARIFISNENKRFYLNNQFLKS